MSLLCTELHFIDDYFYQEMLDDHHHHHPFTSFKLYIVHALQVSYIAGS